MQEQRNSRKLFQYYLGMNNAHLLKFTFKIFYFKCFRIKSKVSFVFKLFFKDNES